MADLTTREIKGISARNLIWLLSGVIMIEFSILMTYNSIIGSQREDRDRIIQVEIKQSKLIDEIYDLKTRVSILESVKK